MTPKYEAIMASVWTGDLSKGTRCEVARCGSPELAQRLAERLNGAEAVESMLREVLASARPHPEDNPTMFQVWRKANALLATPTPSPNR